jgi:hypothetical protein
MVIFAKFQGSGYFLELPTYFPIEKDMEYVHGL